MLFLFALFSTCLTTGLLMLIDAASYGSQSLIIFAQAVILSAFGWYANAYATDRYPCSVLSLVFRTLWASQVTLVGLSGWLLCSAV